VEDRKLEGGSGNGVSVGEASSRLCRLYELADTNPVSTLTLGNAHGNDTLRS